MVFNDFLIIMLTDTGILFLDRSEIIIITHGSANVTKVPKLCMEMRPTERLLKSCFSTTMVKWLKLLFTNTKVSLLNYM